LARAWAWGVVGSSGSVGDRASYVGVPDLGMVLLAQIARLVAALRSRSA